MNAPEVHFHDQRVETLSFLEEVLLGLSTDPKSIPPKFFYDATGSRLFDRICELPEYYLTRTETAILAACGAELAGLVGPDCLLVEFGSGSSRKVRVLLEALQPAAYLPIDISREHLLATARGLARDYPWLRVHATCADYSNGVTLPVDADGRHLLGFFPGSSIGNFDPADALAFLRSVAGLLGPDGALLIGVDLKKDAAVLQAAYNDAQGVTAEFNLNLLAHINRELGADFDLQAFEHCAWYDPRRGRIEMHLRSRHDQSVRLAGHEFRFGAGESLHTENSYKYDAGEFQSLARAAGFKPVRLWTDPERLFSLHYLRVDAAP
ncbi:MAG TPA: L-histidine N(alpha)-methyltransferase [Acidiferrobacterales bacterium]|jgi:dimethylhistidine N-methyltransferase